MRRRYLSTLLIAVSISQLPEIVHSVSGNSPCEGRRSAFAAEPQTFLEFVRTQRDELRKNDAASVSLDEWKTRRKEVRQRLLEAWGGFPTEHAPLNPRHLGTLQRDGYRVEKIIFQTLPAVWMTA